MTARDRNPKHIHNDGVRGVTRSSTEPENVSLLRLEDLTVAIAVGLGAHGTQLWLEPVTISMFICWQ